MYHLQPLLPAVASAPPLHGKRCPSQCSGTGVCNADTGLCDCPAGWGGPDCAAPDKRPCTNRYSSSDAAGPASHIGPDGQDLNWMDPGFTFSRCAGTCDADTGMCYCGRASRHARRPPPPGAPPGAPPAAEGRLLMGKCQRVRTDEAGREVPWEKGNGMPYEMIYGAQGGWCTADRPIVRCDCILDGYDGLACEIRKEAFCPNQCGGRGECERGWCRCRPGWYGLDCARRAEWAPDEPAAAAAAASAVVTGNGTAVGSVAPLASHEEPPSAFPLPPLAAERPWLRAVAVDQWVRNQPAPAAAAAAAPVAGAAAAAAAAPGAAETAAAAAAVAIKPAGASTPAPRAAAAPAAAAAAAAEATGAPKPAPARALMAGGGAGEGLQAVAAAAAAAAAPGLGPQGRWLLRHFRVAGGKVEAQAAAAAAKAGGGSGSGAATGGGGAAAVGAREYDYEPWWGGGGGAGGPSGHGGRAAVEAIAALQQQRRVLAHGPPAGGGVAAGAGGDAGGAQQRALLRHFRIAGGAMEVESAAFAALESGGAAAVNATAPGEEGSEAEEEVGAEAEPSPEEDAGGAQDGAAGTAAAGAGGVPAAVDKDDLDSLPQGAGAGGRMHGFGAESDYESGGGGGDVDDGRRGGASGGGGGEGGGGGSGARRRRRPLIFVYDVPAQFAARPLQYRTSKEKCTWRLFGGEANQTTLIGAAWPYAVEQYLHEAMLQSPHRTLDPEEADLFYVPVYASCLMEAVLGYADKPWYYKYSPIKVQHGALMYLEALNWIKATYPYWDRHQGRDHVWLFTHDEGACWAPAEVYRKSIILTHYGPPQRATANAAASAATGGASSALLPPPSTTARPEFNYSADSDAGGKLGGGWRKLVEGHQCYDPEKDLVIPAFKPPAQYHAAMPLGGMHRKRDILLLLRGEMGDNRPRGYSGGLRQEVYALARDKQWGSKYSIKIGNTREIEGDYSMLLARSVYCLVLPEDGWVSLFEDAALHGCVPVYVTGGPKDLHAPFASILKWGGISLSVQRGELPRLPQILTNVEPPQLANMQRRLARVWHRLAYLDHPAVIAQASEVMRNNLRKYPWIAKEQATMEAAVARGEAGDAIFRNGVRLARRSDADDDAFNTIIQWLHYRARQLRGGGGGGGGGGGEVGVPAGTGLGDAVGADAVAAAGGGGGADGAGGPGGARRRRRRRRRGVDGAPLGGGGERGDAPVRRHHRPRADGAQPQD